MVQSDTWCHEVLRNACSHLDDSELKTSSALQLMLCVLYLFSVASTWKKVIFRLLYFLHPLSDFWLTHLQAGILLVLKKKGRYR